MKKKILYSVLGLVLLSGAIYLGLNINSENGMGFIRLNTINTVKPAVSINDVNNIRIDDSKSNLRLNNIVSGGIINANKFELLDVDAEFDKLSPGVSYFQLSLDGPKELDFYTNEELKYLSFKLKECNSVSQTCKFAVKDQQGSYDKSLSIGDNYIGVFGGKSYLIKVLDIFDFRRVNFSVEAVTSSGVVDHLVPVTASFPTSVVSTKPDLQLSNAGVDNGPSLQVQSCDLTSTVRTCDFLYSDTISNNKLVTIKVGDFVTLKGNSGDYYRVKLHGMFGSSDYTYQVNLEVLKRK